MSTIDIILSIFLGFGVIRGFMRGFIIELFTLVAFVLGIYGAIRFSFIASDVLKDILAIEGKTLSFFSFGITLIVIMIAVMLLAKFITKLLKISKLGFLNRLAGAVFGLLKTSLIVGSVFSFLEKTFQTNQFISEVALENSVLYKPIKALGMLVYQNVFPHFFEF